MNTTRGFSALAAVILVALGCGKSGGSGKSAGPELFAGGIAPPGDLIKVKAGMTIDDVKKVLPTAAPCARQSGSPCLEIASGYNNLRFKVGFYSDKQTVARITVSSAVKGELAALAAKAWGAGTKDTEGMAETTWRDDKTGFIASTSFERDINFQTFIPLNAAYFGTKPGIVGPWQGIALGMTRDEVLAKVPDAAAPKGGGSYIPMSGGPEGVSLDPQFGEDDKVKQLHIRFPSSVAELVEKAWGPGIKTSIAYGVGSKTESTSVSISWFDELAGLRFVVTESTLDIEPYLSYEKLFGAGKDDFGMLPVAVTGKSKADVAAHYGIPVPSSDNITVRLAAGKFSASATPSIDCRFNADKAICSMTVQYSEPAGERDAIIAFLKAKWGEPKMQSEDMKFRDSTPSIVVSDWKQNHQFTFSVQP